MQAKMQPLTKYLTHRRKKETTTPGAPKSYLTCQLLAVNNQHQEGILNFLVKVIGNTQQQRSLLGQVDEPILHMPRETVSK